MGVLYNAFFLPFKMVHVKGGGDREGARYREGGKGEKINRGISVREREKRGKDLDELRLMYVGREGGLRVDTER